MRATFMRRYSLPVVLATFVVAFSAPIAGAAPTAPRPVGTARAQAITEALARKSPPLPASIAALLRGRQARVPSSELRREFDRALASYRAGGDGEHGHGEHWDKNGMSCYAQGFDAKGKLAHRSEHDMNDNGRIDPWELDPNRNETCKEIVLAPYHPSEHDKGSFTLELRTEKDAATGRVHQRIATRWNYVVDNGAHHNHACSPTAAEWKAGMSYVNRAKTSLEKYVGDPLLAWRDGFRPYPVPGTKAFHWFNKPRWDDGHTLDPEHVEVFVATVTDDGWRPVNVSPIYQYNGPDPRSFNPNTDAEASKNAGAGCLVEWHRHLDRFGGAEGIATDNTDGRDWMGHLWIYGGLYPFGDRDVDGSEPHGWYAPLNDVPVFATSEGTGI